MKPFLIALFACFFLFLATWGWLRVWRLEQDNSSNSKTLQEMNLALGRARTEVVTQEKLVEAQKQLSKGLQTELDQTHSRVQSLQTLVASLHTRGSGTLILVPPEEAETEESSGRPLGGDLTRFRYEDYHLRLEVEIASRIVSYELTQHFRGSLVTTVNPDSSQSNYIELYEIGGPEGETKLTLENYSVITLSPTERRWFSPNTNLDLGLAVGWSNGLYLMPELGISFISLGLTSADSDWRFLRFAISTDLERINVSVSPVMYNLKFIPLISNTYEI